MQDREFGVRYVTFDAFVPKIPIAPPNVTDPTPIYLPRNRSGVSLQCSFSRSIAK